MKKTTLTMLFMATLCLLFTSCSKDDDNTNNNDPESPLEPNYLNESDLYGVWKVEGTETDLYFITFSETGRYSFCFNNTLMGAGTYSLDKNKLTLNNGYLFTKDVLDLEQNDKQLNIAGDIHKFKSTDMQNVNITISKTKKDMPISKVGEIFTTFSFLNAYYGNVKERLTYTSEYIMKYEYFKDNALQQMLSEENWYYVCYDNLIYTQKTNGTGNVIIYDLSTQLGPISNKKVKQ